MQNEENDCMKEWKVKALSEAIESNNQLRIDIALDKFTTMELLVLLFRKVFKKK